MAEKEVWKGEGKKRKGSRRNKIK